MPLLALLPGSPTCTPELTGALLDDRNALLHASSTIQNLREQLEAALRDRDTARADVARLEGYLDQISDTGARRYIEYLDDALTAERVKMVSLHAELESVRADLQSSRSAARPEPPTPDASTPPDAVAHLLLKARVADLEIQLERGRATTKAAAEVFNHDQVVQMRAAHHRQMQLLQRRLDETQQQLDDAHALLRAQSFSNSRRSRDG
jgi:enamine deaminase RidA (YjgF/YER057c/UK114 family)